MNLDDKIARSIDAKLEEMAQLFNDVDDASGLGAILQKLRSMDPLLEDIKTEVKAMQDKLNRIPPDEKKKKRKPDRNSNSPSDPDVQDMLKDLPKALEDLKKLYDNLPTPDDPELPPPADAPSVPKDFQVPELLERIPGIKQISDIYQLYKIWKMSRDMMDRDNELLKRLINGEIDIKEYTHSRLEATKEDLQRIIEELSDSMIDDINDKLQDLSGDMSSCCTNMSNKISSVRDNVSAELDYLRLGKLDDISAGLHRIRGLL